MYQMFLVAPAPFVSLHAGPAESEWANPSRSGVGSLRLITTSPCGASVESDGEERRPEAAAAPANASRWRPRAIQLLGAVLLFFARAEAVQLVLLFSVAMCSAVGTAVVVWWRAAGRIELLIAVWRGHRKIVDALLDKHPTFVNGRDPADRLSAGGPVEPVEPSAGAETP